MLQRTEEMLRISKQQARERNLRILELEVRILPMVPQGVHG